MISINGEKDLYVIDLNESMDSEYILEIDSTMPWNVSYTSDLNSIYAKSFSSNKLKITVDLKAIKENEIIILKNLRKETITIMLKPNIEASRERNYVFELGGHTVEGKTISLDVISTENGNTEPWSVEYDGAPMSYVIDKKESKISLTFACLISNEVKSLIILKQDNSGKTIEFNLKHTDSDHVELRQ